MDVKPLKTRIRHFINLTNGVEAIPGLLACGVRESEINYVRIQSTHCESRNYNGILENLDSTFLMNLARGNICLLYDYGSRGTGKLIGRMMRNLVYPGPIGLVLSGSDML